MDEHKEKIKMAYEESVRAYQSHVQRYNAWMNMYAIMTGALFVAFYSVYGNESCNMPCIYRKSLDESVNSILLLLIVLLGFLCSFCWLGVVKGHYEWMKSYIKILKLNEKKYFGDNGPFVYSKVVAPKNVKPKNKNFLHGFYSTQKITLFFIKGVVSAWLFCVAFFISKSICFTVWIVVAFIILCIIHSFWHCDKYSLDVFCMFHSSISLDEVMDID